LRPSILPTCRRAALDEDTLGEEEEEDDRDREEGGGGHQLRPLAAVAGGELLQRQRVRVTAIPLAPRPVDGAESCLALFRPLAQPNEVRAGGGRILQLAQQEEMRRVAEPLVCLTPARRAAPS